MARNLLLAGFVLLSILSPRSSLAQTDPPPDVAKARFAQWLAAFNTGRRETLRRFIDTEFARSPGEVLPVDEITDRQIELYRATGGYLVRRLAVEGDAVRATLQAKITGFWTEARLFLGPQPPHLLVGFGVRNIEAPVDLLPRPRLSDRDIAARLDTLVTRLAQRDAFSGTVLLARNGRPIYRRAVGLASRAWNRPNRLDTKINIASMNKMFTAVAIAQLTERGKLSYTDTVAKLLPDYPNPDVAKRVTVHHLLTHTSGLIGARDSMHLLSPPRGATESLQERLKRFAGEPLRAEPGTRYDYSNVGYILLGAIVERVSGQDYYDYIRTHVYRPTGMTNTDSYALDEDVPNLATGYMDGPTRPRRSNVLHLPARGESAGGGYSTAEDMLRFGTALHRHRLLRAPTLANVWKGHVDADGPGRQYGYGFSVWTYNGQRIVGHSGGWFGVNANFETYPDLGVTFVILANQDAETTPVALRVREWVTQGRAGAAAASRPPKPQAASAAVPAPRAPSPGR